MVGLLYWSAWVCVSERMRGVTSWRGDTHAAAGVQTSNDTRHDQQIRRSACAETTPFVSRALARLQKAASRPVSKACAMCLCCCYRCCTNDKTALMIVSFRCEVCVTETSWLFLAFAVHYTFVRKRLARITSGVQTRTIAGHALPALTLAS